MSFTVRMAVREYRQYNGKDIATSELVKEATPIIKYYLQFYRKFYATREEAFDFGVQKVVDFLDHDYDMSDRTSPGIALRRYIHNAYEREARKSRKDNNKLKKNKRTFGDSDVIVNIPETLPDPRVVDAAERLVRMEEIKRVRQSLDILSPFEREIVRLRFEELYTYQQIGNKYNLSITRVHYLLKKILQKLKDYLLHHEKVELTDEDFLPIAGH